MLLAILQIVKDGERKSVAFQVLAMNLLHVKKGNTRRPNTRERMYDCKLCLGETGRSEARGGQCSCERCARCED